MVVQPWKFFSEVDQDRDYLALSTFLPLAKSSARRAFWRDTRRVEGQLAAAEGLVGYTLRVKLLKRQSWTLSVWDGEASLTAFRAASPHRDVMAPRDWRLGDFKSVRWRLRGADVPPTWGEALDRLAGRQTRPP